MGWAKLLVGVVLAAIVVAAVLHDRKAVGQWVVETEIWIATLGFWGPLVFVVLFVLLTSAFFPDSVLSAVAGALFGPLIGIAVVLIGVFVSQSMAFVLSQRFLQQLVRRIIARRPKLAAIQRAVDEESLWLQFLLRVSPLNPSIVSYIAGTTRTRYGDFVLACVGMLPGLLVEVYFGYAAKHMIKVAGHVSHHSTIHTVMIVVGLVASLLVFVLITRTAQQAIARAEQ